MVHCAYNASVPGRPSSKFHYEGGTVQAFARKCKRFFCGFTCMVVYCCVAIETHSRRTYHCMKYVVLLGAQANTVERQLWFFQRNAAPDAM